MKECKFIKYIFTIIGAGMLIGAFFMYKDTNEFIANSIETKGTVVQLLESRSSKSSNKSIMYTPVVQFINTKGKQMEFSSSTSSNPPKYSINEKVVVIYIPESPNKAKIKSFFDLWGVIIIPGIFGLVFFIIGGRIIIATRKKLKV